jgi:alpha-galactosidase
LAGLYGREGPSSTREGVGCNNTEYQTQMSLWCMMASPLAASNDIRNMNEATKRILLNEEIIALNQDELGKQAIRKIDNARFSVYLKILKNGDKALAIVNKSDAAKNYSLAFSRLGLLESYQIRDILEHKDIGKAKSWKGEIDAHETKVFRLKKI